MTNTSKMIDTLADGYSKMCGGLRDKTFFAKSLESLVRMAISEHNLATDLDYAQCMAALTKKE